MSLNAASLKLMADKGFTAHDIAEIAAANEQAPDSAADKRRTWDRERKQAKREAERNSTGLSTGNPPDGFPNDRDILTPPIPPNVISNEITPPIEISDEVKPEHVVEAWNVMADQAGLPKAKLTPERRKKLRPFLKRHSADDITEAIWAIPRSPFLRGDNDRGWRANFDFLLQPASFTKITEGTYDQQAP